jgi:4-aminobutyrate aminotransferase
VKAILEEDLLGNARERGVQLMDGLCQLKADFPVIGDVRGLGLMIGVEVTRDGEPDTALAKAVVKASGEAGLLLLTCGTYDNVIRWIPPLVVTESEIAEGLQIFASALDRVA